MNIAITFTIMSAVLLCISAVPSIVAYTRNVRNRAPVRFFVWLTFLAAELALFILWDGGGDSVFLPVASFTLLAWIVGMVWSLAASRESSLPIAALSDPRMSPPARPRASSMSYDPESIAADATDDSNVPRKFIINGVDRETKMDTTWRVTANSEANARVKAELEGIVVTSIKHE
jgi:hypothetical protein